MTEYKTEPLKLWKKAKELREDFYKNYADAHQMGGLRWAGGAWTFDAVVAGLGDDVYPLTSEPYGASCAFDRKFSERCLTATESYGYAQDLCAYMRNYWGSVLIGEYAFGGPFPKPDFIFQDQICCSHTKWYQAVSDLENGIPLYSVDVSAGPCEPFGELTDNKINYVAGQLLDGIEWLEKTTKRKFDDEKFIEACWNDFRSTNTWARICELNRAIPAPLDEKAMYSLYVLATLQKSSGWCADFYDELYEEVKDRVERGIAAIGNERFRLLNDSQPPWGFLKIYRYLEEEYGAVCIGSVYTFGLEGILDFNREEDSFRPRPLPGEKPGNREDACYELAKWHLHKPAYQAFYHARYKNEMMACIARNWNVDGIILHYNRGCEGSSLGIAENRLYLLELGFPVLSYEGNMSDEREFDENAIINRFDIFMDTLTTKGRNVSVEVA